MEILKIKLCGKNYAELDTEIKFHIASARATNLDIFSIYFDLNEVNNAETFSANILRILKNEKRLGKIQLFLNAYELSNHSTEAEYLLNKFPNITYSAFNKSSIIIKI